MEPLLLSCIESRVENSRNFYGRFQLGPFVLGQGLTIANSLRRSLLSEISGLAITAVEIEGVAHEYSTIEGIRESVLDILLNIKQIVLTSDFQIQEPQVAFLQVQGPGIVQGKDIKLPISIQSVDPEQYIATLLYDGLLKIKFMICRGKNYLVQTPLGLKIPNSPPLSYKKKEKPFLKLNAEIYLTKSSNTLRSHKSHSDVKKMVLKGNVKSKKQNVNFNPFLSKKSNKSFFASFLQIEDLQDHQQEEKSATLIDHKPDITESSLKSAHDMSESNSDVTVDLSNNSQNEKNISPVYSTSSEETLLNSNKTELSFFNTLLPLGGQQRGQLEGGEGLTKTTFSEARSVNMPKEGVTISEKKNTIDSKILQKQKKEYKTTSNILPIDAVFMPINRVNFTIELNNESTAPKDLVILEVWTNGSIHPKQAINEAAKALIQLITPFQETKNFKSVFINSPKVLQRKLSSSNIGRSPSNITYGDLSMLEGLTKTTFSEARSGSTTLENMNLPADISERNVRTKKNIKLLPHLPASEGSGQVKIAKQETARFSEGKHRNSLLNKNIASLDIGNLDLSLRPYTCLKRANIETVADLLSYSAEDLLNLKNFGKRSLSEIEQNLNQMGLKLHS